MARASLPNDNLMVAIRREFALVSVHGRGTFKLATSLKRFCVNAFAKGCHEIVFDMLDCTGMDSTFMGVLAGVAMWPAGPEIRHRHVLVINLTPRTHGMLTTLGLERILKCFEQNDTPMKLKARLAEALQISKHLPAEASSRRVSLDTMLQAHQHLAEADVENMVRFRDVLTYLEQEVKREDA